MREISPDLPTSRTDKAEDCGGDMEQRTLIRRTGTTSENFDCNRNGYGGDNDVKDIKKDDGQRKKSIPEMWRNNTLLDETLSCEYQRSGSTPEIEANKGNYDPKCEEGTYWNGDETYKFVDLRVRQTDVGDDEKAMSVW